MGDVAYITTDVPCPVCRYNLRGLPTDRACPECGLKIDRHVTFADPHREKRDKFIDEFDAMMEEREKLERAAADAVALNLRQERAIERWERLAGRLEQVLDLAEEKLRKL
jgi:hypothetical protein